MEVQTREPPEFAKTLLDFSERLWNLDMDSNCHGLILTEEYMENLEGALLLARWAACPSRAVANPREYLIRLADMRPDTQGWFIPKESFRKIMRQLTAILLETRHD